MVVSAPVARWYHEPENWLREATDQDGTYRWIHHFIAELGSGPIGFCQYYEYRLSGESWHGSADVEGAYSVDYLIGEPFKGLGRQMVAALTENIRQLGCAKRIIVQPEPDNHASRGLLRLPL